MLFRISLSWDGELGWAWFCMHNNKILLKYTSAEANSIFFLFAWVLSPWEIKMLTSLWLEINKIKEQTSLFIIHHHLLLRTWHFLSVRLLVAEAFWLWARRHPAAVLEEVSGLSPRLVAFILCHESGRLNSHTVKAVNCNSSFFCYFWLRGDHQWAHFLDFNKAAEPPRFRVWNHTDPSWNLPSESEIFGQMEYERTRRVLLRWKNV